MDLWAVNAKNASLSPVWMRDWKPTSSRNLGKVGVFEISLLKHRVPSSSSSSSRYLHHSLLVTAMAKKNNQNPSSSGNGDRSVYFASSFISREVYPVLLEAETDLKDTMGFSKDQLIGRLKDLQVEFSQYEHPPVMTVEEQAKYVGNMGGALSKNLFLKDKKHRYYIVSALPNTKVDMKVLSQRLGLGKGGVRMAPEEALLDILQVPLGTVTPFAVVNESARDVSLLLDKGFKAQERCFFHPLSNEVSISLNTNDLDKFLRSIGRDPPYVDLEANPPVGKDQPPDLVAFVPTGSTVIPDAPEKAASSQGASGNHVTATSNSRTATEKTKKSSSNVQNVKDKSANNAVNPSKSFMDSEKFVEEILDRISAQLLSETKEGSMKQQGEDLGSELASKLRKCCSSELKNLATIFKNTAYTQGFHAGKASSLR